MNLCRCFLDLIERSKSPQGTIQELRGLVCGILQDGPAWIGLMMGAAFLGALSLWRNPNSLMIYTDYLEVAEAMAHVTEDESLDMRDTWEAWKQNQENTGKDGSIG